MKDSVFVDTNALCAMYNIEDSLYSKKDQIESILRDYAPIVSNFILLETYTVLSQRVSKKFAIAFGERVKTKHPYSIFWINKEFEQEIWKIFSLVKDKNFSYVDASTLAIMQKEKISHLFSFDTEFKKLETEFRFKLIC